MANNTPFLTPLKMEELIELVQSNPGVYNQTKKRYTKTKSKKLDVGRMTDRLIYIAYPSGQMSK